MPEMKPWEVGVVGLFALLAVAVLALLTMGANPPDMKLVVTRLTDDEVDVVLQPNAAVHIFSDCGLHGPHGVLAVEKRLLASDAAGHPIRLKGLTPGETLTVTCDLGYDTVFMAASAEVTRTIEVP